MRSIPNLGPFDKESGCVNARIDTPKGSRNKFGNMSSLWGLGGVSWKTLGKRVISEIRSDDVFGRAAQLAYYFLLALFPLLLFLTSVIGLLLGSGTGVRHALFAYCSRVLPGAASNLVDSTMYEVTAASGGGKLTFG